MPVAYPGLPTNRTNGTVTYDDHAANHNAANDAINQTILALNDHTTGDDPHQQYLLPSEANLAYAPAGSAYTKAESDLRYLPIGYVPPPVDLSGYYTKTEGDLRYEQFSNKGVPSGYAPLGTDGLLPPAHLPPLAITDTFVVTSEAAMLALPAQRGDVAIRSDEDQTYILVADPASVLGNWVGLVSSSLTGNVTVVQREEFSPAAAATTVTLAAPPTEVLSVSRNGVEQSASAGHYTVAGSVVTVTDAFGAGEVLGVVYEVGTSIPVNTYTKAESNARFVNAAGDTMTGPLLFSATDVYDIGASDGSKPRNLYLGGSVAVRAQAGAPVDGDFTAPIDGMLAVDTDADALYFRSGGEWHQATGGPGPSAFGSAPFGTAPFGGA